jgi:diaminopimelate decarboxylase
MTVSIDPLLWPCTATVAADDHLSLGGCDVVRLARQWGTPLYIIDAATLEATAQRYRSALADYPAPSAVHYASKALLNTAIAQIVTSYGLGLDCVSIGELAVARHAGVDLQHVHLHGNAKPRRELVQALDWGVGRIVIDSLDELRLLSELTRDRVVPQPILLRLNPGIGVHTHAHIQTGQLDSKFGLPIATGMAWEAAGIALEAPGLQLVGLHVHLGSQIANMLPLVTGIERLLDFAAELQSRWGWQMQELSPGGGLAVPYRQGDQTPGIPEYMQTIIGAVVGGSRNRGLPLPKLVLEPGRSLIAQAVVALYEVVSVKMIPGVRTYVAVDGGMGDNLRPALYNARYTALRADAVTATPSTIATVAGRYCESGDILLRDVPLPVLEPGALLAMPMVGAYTLSMASTYNMVSRPPLFMVRDGQVTILQRRETIEDLVRRDCPILSE